jgi:hypothetical protein
MLGLFWVASSFLDVLGLIPYSEATPPLSWRALHSIPLMIAGGLYLFPCRVVGSDRLRVGIAGALTPVVAWSLYLSIEGAGGYLSGRKSWHVVPAAVLLLAVAVGNLWAFTRVTKDAGHAVRWTDEETTTPSTRSQ